MSVVHKKMHDRLIGRKFLGAYVETGTNSYSTHKVLQEPLKSKNGTVGFADRRKSDQMMTPQNNHKDSF